MATRPLTPAEKRARKKKFLIRRIVFCAALAAVLALLILLIVSIARALAPKKTDAAADTAAQTAAFTQIGPYQAALPTDLEKHSNRYDYASPVPEAEAVADSYFTDALFLGDSRTQGLSLYGVIPSAEILASPNVGIADVMNYSFDLNGAATTLTAQLAAKTYSCVYISLGMNELGWNYPDEYISRYSELIDAIREKQPLTQIYIQSLLPVSASLSGSSDTYNNARIDDYNARLLALAAKKSVYYLDVASAYKDTSGALPADATSDGINLYSGSFDKWLSYLKTHTVSKESYKN